MKLIAPKRSGPLFQALDFQRRTIELVADEVLPIEAGFIVRTPSLPQVWSLNHVRITVPVPLATMVRIADEALADLPYRDLRVEFPEAEGELEHALRDAGWMLEREVVMALRRPPDRQPVADAVSESSEVAIRPLMHRWFAEGPPEITEEGLRQLVEYSRREAEILRDQIFTINDEGGAAVAMTKLRSDGRTAQVEDVYTAPEARGHGYARALLTHITERARAAAHGLIFIVADDEDWPKHLYEKIGFEPIGYTRTAHLKLG
ncbi:MAG: GNAT family N-acetyltransferase [Solirubrobacterales bacterium]|nr:GNAT family N-acetyltransferase [Solirubrobacterales bacterium]